MGYSIFMPRKRRFYLPEVPVHIVQRGRCRKAVFYEDEDYHTYLHWFGIAAERYNCAIHAYVLMTNHVHLLLTPKTETGPSQMMQYLGRHYVAFINKKYGRSGSIWEGRYKASLVQAEAYLLACMRYIELNPVSAEMVAAPQHYRWSSYACNALGKANTLIQPHEVYQRMGLNQAERLEAYRELFAAHIDSSEAQAIRMASQSGTPLGDLRFAEQIEATLGRKVGQARRGRPAGYKTK